MPVDSPISKINPATALQSIELFAELEAQTREDISKRIKWKQFKKGVEVVSYRSRSDEVYFIASGQVRTTIYTFTGKEISYQELGAGDMFGELSAIDRLPRTANVITQQASQIGVMSANEYWKLIEQYPSIAAFTLQRMAKMVRFLIDRVYQYGALDVKDRVRMEVLRLARENMIGEDSAEMIDFPTHKEIASRVNTHREAVTRELNELSRMGLIEKHHRCMKVASVNEINNLLQELI